MLTVVGYVGTKSYCVSTCCSTSNVSFIKVFKEDKELHWSNGLFAQDFDVMNDLVEKGYARILSVPKPEEAKIFLGAQGEKVSEDYTELYKEAKEEGYELDVDVFIVQLPVEIADRLNSGRKYY